MKKSDDKYVVCASTEELHQDDSKNLSNDNTVINQDDDTMYDANSSVSTLLPQYHNNESSNEKNSSPSSRPSTSKTVSSQESEMLTVLSAPQYDFPVFLKQTYVHNDLVELKQTQLSNEKQLAKIDDEQNHSRKHFYVQNGLVLRDYYYDTTDLDHYFQDYDDDEEEDSLDDFEPIQRMLFAWYNFGPCSTLPETLMGECHLPSKQEVEYFNEYEGDIYNSALYHEYYYRHSNNHNSKMIANADSNSTIPSCYTCSLLCNASIQVEYSMYDNGINSLLSLSFEQDEEEDDDYDGYSASSLDTFDDFNYEKNILITEYLEEPNNGGCKNRHGTDDNISSFEMSFVMQKCAPKASNEYNNNGDDDETVEYNHMTNSPENEQVKENDKKIKSMMQVMLKVYEIEGKGTCEFELNLMKHTTNKKGNLGQQHQAINAVKCFKAVPPLLSPKILSNKIFLQAYEFNGIMFYELSVQHHRHKNIETLENGEKETIQNKNGMLVSSVNDVKLQAYEYKDIILYELTLKEKSYVTITKLR